MADALCGPSNALQNFQKHTSVDRTLQQDRLVARQSPQQDFRSGPAQHAGALDHEFEAFQAGHAPPPQPDALHFPAQHAPPGYAGPAGALPDWAADFQRLHVSSPPPHVAHQQHFQAPQHNHTASWHQDFLRQQQQQGSPATHQMAQGSSGSMYSGRPMFGYGMGQFQQQQPFMAQQESMAAQARQKDPVFDDAAFTSAFDAAAAEALEAEHAARTEAGQSQESAPAQEELIPTMSQIERDIELALPSESDAVLAYMKEHAFNEYCRHMMSEFLPRANAQHPNEAPRTFSLASLYMAALEKLESKEMLQNMAPDPLLGRVLEEITNANDLVYDEQFQFRARASRLLNRIGQNHPSYLDQDASQRAREAESPQLRATRLKMFQNSMQDDHTAERVGQIEHEKWTQVEAMTRNASDRFAPVEAMLNPPRPDIRATIRSQAPVESLLNQRPQELLRDLSPPDMILHETPQVPQQQQAEQEQPRDMPNHDDEELARTAGQLVESVSHDRSEKFVHSRFLALMRQLRDHEVRVDGDKIVETTPNSTIPANQQDLDLGRGDDARTMTGALQADSSDDHDIGNAFRETMRAWQALATRLPPNGAG